MNLHGLSIILADAAQAPATQPNPSGQLLNMLGPLVLMIVIMYLILIRPQSKKAKEQAAMLKSMKPGDKIITSSGIVGTVVSVKEKTDTVSIRSAETKLEVLKSSISNITDRSGESAATES